jgi:hypothetical protein
MNAIRVFLEMGQKRVFASALDWPGWCRGGRDEASALQALVDYGARYAQALQPMEIGFQAPPVPADINVIERHAGNATTDFGAPGIIPDADRAPLDRAEFERLQEALLACWGAFDHAVQLAVFKELRKGPRGGGRDLDSLLEHVLGGEQAYLGRLAWKFKPEGAPDSLAALSQTRQAVLAALAAGMRGELPEQGPRGGAVWPLRYFIRRSAWHVLDHAWEIEDRIEN